MWNLRPLQQLGIRDSNVHRHMFTHRPCPSQRFENPDDSKLPYRLSFISTNGLDVKATLVTLVRKTEGGNGGPNNADNQTLAEGTAGLVKKKYDGVTGVLDLGMHRQGVLKSSKEHDDDALDHIGIGVDPVHIELFPRVQERMTGANSEEEFSKRIVIESQALFSGKRSEALSLRANAERHEARRERANKRYGKAIRKLGRKTLKTSNSSTDYLSTWYVVFPVLKEELLSQPRRLRRFARFRARERCLAHVAEEVLYGS